MKHGKFIVSLLVAILLVSCAPIKPFQDIRDKDVKNHGNLGEALIKTLWFNESTIWTEKDKALAENIMKLGMDPGLGIRALHSEGITGQGVNVAIIDQNMVLDHPEVRGKIVKYFDAGTKTAADEGSMHGPAVTSLLVGENIGTAPEANVYYAAAPSWTGDAQYYADALNWIVEENEKLPVGEKIRVVSVSAIPSGEGSPFTKNNDAWDDAYQRQQKRASSSWTAPRCTESQLPVPTIYTIRTILRNASLVILGLKITSPIKVISTFLHLIEPLRKNMRKAIFPTNSMDREDSAGLCPILQASWQWAGKSTLI